MSHPGLRTEVPDRAVMSMGNGCNVQAGSWLQVDKSEFSEGRKAVKSISQSSEEMREF